MCPKRVLSMYMFWTFPWSLDMFCVTYKKCPKCGHFPFWKNLSSMCPKKCPNFGHIVDIFLILLPCLDIFCAPNYKCPKCDQPELNVSIKCPKIGHIMDIFLQFGCFLDILSKVGHVFGTFWVLVTFLDTLWTLLGTLRPKCVRPHIVLQCPFSDLYHIV